MEETTESPPVVVVVVGVATGVVVVEDAAALAAVAPFFLEDLPKLTRLRMFFSFLRPVRFRLGAGDVFPLPPLPPPDDAGHESESLVDFSKMGCSFVKEPTEGAGEPPRPLPLLRLL